MLEDREQECKPDLGASFIWMLVKAGPTCRETREVFSEPTVTVLPHLGAGANAHRCTFLVSNLYLLSLLPLSSATQSAGQRGPCTSLGLVKEVHQSSAFLHPSDMATKSKRNRTSCPFSISSKMSLIEQKMTETTKGLQMSR